jgi:hypothetical protein
MRARLNTKVGPHDPMDLNEDGKITEADVQMLMTQCTHPRCAVPAVKPKTATLTPPLVQSATGPQGGTVSLQWGAVSGAIDYLVYEIACSGSINTPPPAAALAACSQPNAPTICTMLPKVVPATTPALFGYPGAPTLLGRVTATTYTGAATNSLQALYFIVAEDGSGDLSSPSNVVGAPSLASCGPVGSFCSTVK